MSASKRSHFAPILILILVTALAIGAASFSLSKRANNEDGSYGARTFLLNASNDVGNALAATENVGSDALLATEAVGDILYATADLHLVTTTMIMVPASMAEQLLPPLETSMHEDVALMASSVQTLFSSLADYPDAVALVEQISGLIATSGEQRQSVLDLIAAGDPNAANQAYQQGYRQTLMQIQSLATELRPLIHKNIQAQKDAIHESNKALNESLMEFAKDPYDDPPTVTAALLGLAAIALVSGISAAILLVRSPRKTGSDRN